MKTHSISLLGRRSSNEDKHKIFVSSHPSPLSCTKVLKKYPSFNKSKIFLKINNYLKKMGKQTIDWSLN